MFAIAAGDGDVERFGCVQEEIRDYYAVGIEVVYGQLAGGVVG